MFALITHLLFPSNFLATNLVTLITFSGYSNFACSYDYTKAPFDLDLKLRSKGNNRKILNTICETELANLTYIRFLILDFIFGSENQISNLAVL